ncbi:unnamed protein product, partial [Heterotrigona itama]
MAFLYIDRIKRDFQRTDHCLSRRMTCRKWSPDIVIKRLNGQTPFDDHRCISEEFPAKRSFMNLLPKIPRIFTIGLKLDRKDDSGKNACQFWNIASVKSFFKQYFSFIRRCQSYLHISWKCTPNEDDFQFLSFSSSTSTISRCRRCCCHHKSHCVMLRRKHARLPRECEACSGEFSTKSPSKLESCGNIEQCQRKFIENAEGKVDSSGDTHLIVSAAVDKDNKEQSDCTEAKFAKFLSESGHNSLSMISGAACNDQAVKSKKDAYCQTTFRSVKSYHGNGSKKDHVEQSSKEDNYISTNASSSKNIETIFTTTNFDEERSKTNLESLREAASRKRRTKRTDKRSRKHDAENSSRKERSRTPCASAGSKRSVFNRETGREPTRERKLVKRKTHEAIKDKANSSTETFFDCDSVTNFADGDSIRIPPRGGRVGKTEPSTFIENYDIRDISSNRNRETRVKSANVNSPQNYWIEDKTSELMILGNVKKRLEEDYDDYFSVDNDLFLDAEDPSDIAKVDPPSMQYNPNESRSVTVTKHQQLKQELTKRSIRTSLTCTSSICFTNSDLSSYHTSTKEQEYSHRASTSIEHHAADNVSPSNFQSFGDDSFNSFVQIYSLDTGLSRGNNLRTSGWESCFSNDEADLVNSSYTVCCYQRNSTPNLSNSSKLIAESLDSGILTDCSRDRLRIRLGEKSDERVKQQGRKRHARKNDPLPVCDLNTDSSYSDDSLNRRVDIVVKKFTDNLILAERRARTKLRSMGNSSGHGQVRKRRKGQVRPYAIAKSMIAP